MEVFVDGHLIPIPDASLVTDQQDEGLDDHQQSSSMLCNVRLEPRRTPTPTLSLSFELQWKIERTIKEQSKRE